MTRRALLVIAVVATVGAALGVAPARADGDPASDVLYLQDVFLPYAKPSTDVAAQLTSAVVASAKAGVRIKVAVIASPQDLGSVPSLFGRPALYARFLGTELREFYTQRLLVVMPAGFGIYDGGQSTTREVSALAALTIDSPDPDGLTRAATAAVQKLQQTVATPARKDTTPPAVRALASTGTRGKAAKLRYSVFDGSGKSREVVRVYGPNLLLLASIPTRLAKAKPRRNASVVWKVPAGTQPGKLKFCVLAQDPSGNQSRTSCAPLTIS
jgi:hypothetical protein